MFQVQLNINTFTFIGIVSFKTVDLLCIFCVDLINLVLG